MAAVNAQDLHDIPLSHPAIGYGPATNDPLAVILRDAKLRERLESTDRSQLLKTLLDMLKVPQESQMLVFLSPSLQGQRIKKDNPRALYFNDSVSVGWVRGGFAPGPSTTSTMNCAICRFARRRAASPAGPRPRISMKSVRSSFGLQASVAR